MVGPVFMERSGVERCALSVSPRSVSPPVRTGLRQVSNRAVARAIQRMTSGTERDAGADAGEFVLRQQSRSEGQRAENLPDDYDVMVTGSMGECVSVIVLWGRDGNRYRHVRGYHGFGGIAAVDTQSLFEGVPDDEGTLAVICRSPTSSDSEFATGELNECQAHLPHAIWVRYKNASNYQIDRAGECRPSANISLPTLRVAPPPFLPAGVAFSVQHGRGPAQNGWNQNGGVRDHEDGCGASCCLIM